MSDETNPQTGTPEFPDTIEYFQESDLPENKNFPTTKKSGYAEEEVDVWKKEVFEKATRLLTAHNNLAYIYMQLKDQYKRALTAGQDPNVVEGLIQQHVQEALNQQHAQLNDEFQQHYANLQATYQDRENQINAHYQGQLAEAASVPVAPLPEVAAPVVADVPVDLTEHQVVSAHAQKILDNASQRATAHVEETHASMEQLLNEARVEAEQTVADAHSTAQKLIRDAQEEANKAIVLKNEAVTERKEIFDRLKMFYDAQLSSISEEENRVGLSPVLGSSEDLVDVQGDEPNYTPDTSYVDYEQQVVSLMDEPAQHIYTVQPETSADYATGAVEDVVDETVGSDTTATADSTTDGISSYSDYVSPVGGDNTDASSAFVSSEPAPVAISLDDAVNEQIPTDGTAASDDTSGATYYYQDSVTNESVPTSAETPVVGTEEISTPTYNYADAPSTDYVATPEQTEPVEPTVEAPEEDTTPTSPVVDQSQLAVSPSEPVGNGFYVSSPSDPVLVASSPEEARPVAPTEGFSFGVADATPKETTEQVDPPVENPPVQ